MPRGFRQPAIGSAFLRGASGLRTFGAMGSSSRAHGRMPIKELERLTGYTRRYLNILFKQHVGLPPKVLAGIFRFQMFY